MSEVCSMGTLTDELRAMGARLVDIADEADAAKEEGQAAVDAAKKALADKLREWQAKLQEWIDRLDPATPA